MTGFFIRIMRGGKAQNVDVAEMTDAELDAFFDGVDVDRAAAWAKALAKWIRDNIVRAIDPKVQS